MATARPNEPVEEVMGGAREWTPSVDELREVTAPDSTPVTAAIPDTNASVEGNPIAETPTSNPGTEWSPVTPTPKSKTKTKTVATPQRQLQNADINFNEYWDDSSAPNQAQAWGMNEKYEWEWVDTSNLEYDPNATVAWLDPSYKFWMAWQWANSDSEGYLARRNDQIASALWNDSKWRVSKEDVIYYLASQEGWNNSSEADRFNTVESIWKRIGQLQAQQWEQPEEESTATDSSGVDKLKEDEAQKGGTIYGKDTPDEKSKIKTNVDEMNVESDIARSRTNKLDFLRTMDSASIAASIVSGTIPYGDQAWRDLQTYYPEKAAEVKSIEKQIRWQNTVNSITQWGIDYDTTIGSDLEGDNINFAVSNANYITSATDILKSIDSILESNEAAGSAKDVMALIEEDMAKLKSRLKGLKKEANTVFRWDVPDYIVKAYVANRTAEIQDNMQILEDRYNAAYNRWAKETSDAQWQLEYDLKKRQLELQEKQFEVDKNATEEWIKINWAKLEKENEDDVPAASRTRTERNNNPTAMTTEYAEALWLQLWVDYEIWDSFIGKDVNGNPYTYYTAKFIWDPYEAAIHAFDVWASNNAYANQWGVLSHWKLWISNQDWLELTDWEKREVIDKILKQEWGKMWNMSYYKSINSGDSAWWRKDWKTFDLNNSPTYQELSNKDKGWVKSLLNLSASYADIVHRWNDFDSPSDILVAVQEINPDWTRDDVANAKTAVNKWTTWWEWGWLDRAATAVDFAQQFHELISSIPADDWNTWVWALGVDNIIQLSELDKSVIRSIGNTKVVEAALLLHDLVNEYAGALKWWNSSLAVEDEQRMAWLIPLGLSHSQMQTAAERVAKSTFDKVVTAWITYKTQTLEKPTLSWVPAAASWVYKMRPEMTKYFNVELEDGLGKWGNAPTYNPWWAWSWNTTLNLWDLGLDPNN